MDSPSELNAAESNSRVNSAISPKQENSKPNEFNCHFNSSPSNPSSPEIPPESEVTEGWTFLLSSTKEYDRNLLDNWKDELNNLLVFAGLFSAVVTAYTIESYQWLQEDTAGQTVQLLTQISNQLASFSVTPAFINATVPPLSSSPPFRPADVYVTINMLWFLSLTLSLLVAFFVIAVQQWLRALSLPQYLTSQETLYLRNARHSALVTCQVPGIITVLPVTLQAAVLLFLVGLYHFLHGLNHPITIAITVAAGLPFVLYTISLFLPLLWPHCPFKSPLVPSAAFLLHWIWVVLRTAVILIICLVMLLYNLLLICWVFGAWPCSTLCGTGFEFFMAAADKLQDGVGYMHFKRPVTSVLSHITDFWADREVRGSLCDSDNWDLSTPLLSSSNAIRTDEFRRLRACLLALPVHQRSKCILEWTLSSHRQRSKIPHIGFSGTVEDRSKRRWVPIPVDVLQGVNKAFARRYATFLLDAVPTELEVSSHDYVVEDTGSLSAVLLLLMQVIVTGSAEPSFCTNFIRVLCRLLHTQWRNVNSPDTHVFSDKYTRIPAVCLFKCLADTTYNVSIREATALVSTLDRFVAEALHFNLRDDSEPSYHPERQAHNNAEAIFALTATVLIVSQRLAQDGHPQDEIEEEVSPILYKTLGAFNRFIGQVQHDVYWEFSREERESHEYYEQRLAITHEAAHSIATSLTHFAQAGRYGPSTSMALLTSTVIQGLAMACGERDGFSETLSILEQLRSLYQSSSLASMDGGTTPVVELQPAMRLETNDAVMSRAGLEYSVLESEENVSEDSGKMLAEENSLHEQSYSLLNSTSSVQECSKLGASHTTSPV